MLPPSGSNWQLIDPNHRRTKFRRTHPGLKAFNFFTSCNFFEVEVVKLLQREQPVGRPEAEVSLVRQDERRQQVDHFHLGPML